MGGFMFIMLGIFGESGSLSEGQSIGIGLLLLALVPCLLAAVNLFLRSWGERGRSGNPSS
jgi:hypothetical protein